MNLKNVDRWIEIYDHSNSLLVRLVANYFIKKYW